MLSEKNIELVKSTIPLLEQAGTAVTNHFYKRMFAANPELKDIFNMSNQVNGRQQVALFSAVAAYAKYIDNLAVLNDAVERIAQKHTSFNIQPAQYQIVGHHLLETLRELAPNEFNDEIAAAWTAAYQFLADIFIERETELYKASAAKPGGWVGERSFRVSSKIRESEFVYSFTFIPVDGLEVSHYLPGQYIAVNVKPKNSENIEIRQYSLSDKYHNDHYRISVKRELNPQVGVVSNYLHDHVEVGDVINLMPPAGSFHYQHNESPTVLISAGVGITPMMSIIETLAENNHGKKVLFLHTCRTAQQHSFKNRIAALSQQSWFEQYVWYTQAETDNTDQNELCGLMQLNALREKLPLSHGHFYLCGPITFMHFIREQLNALEVPEKHIHYEVFGPHEDI